MKIRVAVSADKAKVESYPFVCPSWEESERKLSELLSSDPLLIGDYKSTKGYKAGMNSFDDRAWVEFIVEA